MKNNSAFWLKMLRLGAAIVFVTGLLPILAVFESTQEPWRFFFDILTWPIDQTPATFLPGERQISAVLGGVLCGWSWLMFQLARSGVFNSRIRSFMIQSTWMWFVLDSGGSILSGIPLNAVGNVSFLLVLLIPLHKLKG